MDTNYPENADPRPKRRKDKDNPYTIYSIGRETDHPKYFVRFTDGEGIDHCQEISKELFDLMNEFELDDLSYLNEVDRHYGMGNITDTIDPNTPEDSFMEELGKEYAQACLSELPEIQQRRIRLYYFECHTYQQIADMEGCTKRAVKFTIDRAVEVLRKKLKNF